MTKKPRGINMEFIDYNDYTLPDGGYDWVAANRLYLELSELCKRLNCAVIIKQSPYGRRKKSVPKITMEDISESIRKVTACENVISFKVIKNREPMEKIKIWVHKPNLNM